MNRKQVKDKVKRKVTRELTRSSLPGIDLCSMGVGCNEAGICYAEAHGEPEQCPFYKSSNP